MDCGVRSFGERRVKSGVLAQNGCRRVALGRAGTDVSITRASRRPGGDGYSSVLGQCGRRVLENARAKERRFDPLRGQRRNCRKLDDRNGGAYKRHRRRMGEAARRDECYRAGVPGLVCIRVNGLVQLR
jgi:hypothetical protein